MNTYAETKDQGRLAGAIAALLYLVVLVVAMCLVHFTLNRPVDPLAGSILVDFGDMVSAAPGGDPALNEQSNPVDPTSAMESPADQLLTQEHPDQAHVRERPERPTPPSNRPVTSTNRPAESTPAPPRQSDPRAQFPGRTAGSAHSSEGTGTGQGNQGDPSGSPEGSHQGTGSGGTGQGRHSLSGRSLVGILPRPSYDLNDEGKVVLDIVVDQEGNVVSTAYRAAGSTTNHSTLVRLAELAARQSRFNVDENAPVRQSGTITYIFTSVGQ